MTQYYSYWWLLVLLFRAVEVTLVVHSCCVCAFPPFSVTVLLCLCLVLFCTVYLRAIASSIPILILCLNRHFLSSECLEQLLYTFILSCVYSTRTHSLHKLRMGCLFLSRIAVGTLL